MRESPEDMSEISDISQLVEQNPWWIKRERILEDSKLQDLSRFPFQWDPALRHHIHLDHDVIYTIRGPRQVGKTTLLKMIIRDLLLKKKVPPESIFYWSFERNTRREFHDILKTYLHWEESSSQRRRYLFLDEVCRVKDWSHELVYFANRGAFTHTSIIVTGSQARDLKYSTERMPGRRGGYDEETLDKILLPMKFSEFIRLVSQEMREKLFELRLIGREKKQKIFFTLFKGDMPSEMKKLLLFKRDLDKLLNTYLITGGFPRIINEYKAKKRIPTRAFNVYLQAILGDLHQYKQREYFMRQIVREIIDALSNPISWSSISKKTDIKSHSTVQEYIETMEEIYLLTVTFKYDLHERRGNYLSDKKIYFLDPFILHTLNAWVRGKRNYFESVKESVLNPEMKSKLIENIVHNHLSRLAYNLHPIDLFDPKEHVFYYRKKRGKNEQEVDFLLHFEGSLYPIEVKYRSRVRKSDFARFKPFGRGLILTKDDFKIEGKYVALPVSIFLTLI